LLTAKRNNMKKNIFLIVLGTVSTISIYAQSGGIRKTVAERVARVHQKLDSVYHFAADKQAKIDSAFAHQYRAQESLMLAAKNANTSDGKPDPAAREIIRDKIEGLGAARDEKLKTIMTDAEYKKWKEEVEPAIRPKRGQGWGN
jgi:periplasmic protein CpxP/Spy